MEADGVPLTPLYLSVLHFTGIKVTSHRHRRPSEKDS